MTHTSLNTAKKTSTRTRRHARIRARVSGTAARPRLAVFRSNKALYAQLIDDERAVTLAAADSRAEKGATLRERSVTLGIAIGAKAKEKGIEKVVFDRGGFQYEGIVAAFAESARAAGLVF
jgi:large subunit ribosomal protein L18